MRQDLRVRAVNAPEEAVAALQLLQRRAAAMPLPGLIQRGRKRARLLLQAAQVSPQRLKPHSSASKAVLLPEIVYADTPNPYEMNLRKPFAASTFSV